MRPIHIGVRHLPDSVLVSIGGPKTRVSGAAVRRSRLWLAAGLVLVVTAGCTTAARPARVAQAVTTTTSSPPPPTAAPSTEPPTTAAPPRTIVAQAVVAKVAVYGAPRDGLPALQTLDNPRPLGGPLAMVVFDQQPGWLNVSLPVRPNESSGWVKASDFSLSQHTFRIVIELHAHRITVYNGYSIVDQEPIGTGTSNTPTAGGIFYTADAIQVVPPTGPYGPYAFGLSGFSNVLTSFGGGPGQLAIHGTNQPQLIGQDVSHGCIRMSNAGITKLAQMLPLGVPVAILA